MRVDSKMSKAGSSTAGLSSAPACCGLGAFCHFTLVVKGFNFCCRFGGIAAVFIKGCPGTLPGIEGKMDAGT